MPCTTIGKSLKQQPVKLTDCDQTKNIAVLETFSANQQDTLHKLAHQDVSARSAKKTENAVNVLLRIYGSTQMVLTQARCTSPRWLSWQHISQSEPATSSSTASRVPFSKLSCSLSDATQ